MGPWCSDGSLFFCVSLATPSSRASDRMLYSRFDRKSCRKCHKMTRDVLGAYSFFTYCLCCMHHNVLYQYLLGSPLHFRNFCSYPRCWRCWGLMRMWILKYLLCFWELSMVMWKLNTEPLIYTVTVPFTIVLTCCSSGRTLFVIHRSI